MSWVVTAANPKEPVSLAEAVEHLRDPPDATHAKIAALITAARQHIEKVCERALMTQTWRASWDCFPDGELWLPGGLVTSITTVAYTDANGVAQTLAANATGYQADLDSQPARLMPAPGVSWPATQADKFNAVQVTYAVGYADAASVPYPLKAALLLIVADLFENRDGAVIGAAYEANPTIKALLMPFKRVVP